VSRGHTDGVEARPTRPSGENISTAATAEPSEDRPSLAHRLWRIAIWVGGVALLLVACNLLGVPVSSWIQSLWDTLREVSLGYLLAAVALSTTQTYLTALAWFYILRAAYPSAGIRQGPILAVYATAVAMNGVLPANIGSFTMLLMYTAIIAGATFAGVVAGYLVHKIFFMLIGIAVYVYLFLSVPGSFDIQLGNISDHPILTIAIAGGVLALLALLARIFWRSVKKLWAKAKQGGVILGHPREYCVKVLLPQMGGYAAKLGVIAVFLAAFSIPVTFHSVMSVVGSNSLANVTSVTPGGVGVNQALNAASLRDYTDTATATAYSISQQLITTAWNVVFAVALVAYFFGWSGGKTLVGTSYAGAKVKVADARTARKEKRARGHAHKEA
jgi:uncharacterized membrane protein YbhN (UPF0104 family)